MGSAGRVALRTGLGGDYPEQYRTEAKPGEHELFTKTLHGILPFFFPQGAHNIPDFGIVARAFCARIGGWPERWAGLGMGGRGGSGRPGIG